MGIWEPGTSLSTICWPDFQSSFLKVESLYSNVLMIKTYIIPVKIPGVIVIQFFFSSKKTTRFYLCYLALWTFRMIFSGVHLLINSADYFVHFWIILNYFPDNTLSSFWHSFLEFLLSGIVISWIASFFRCVFIGLLVCILPFSSLLFSIYYF